MKKILMCVAMLALAGCALNGGVSAAGGSNGIGVGLGLGTGIRF